MLTTNVFSRNLKAFNDGARLIGNQGGQGCFNPEQLIITRTGGKKISEIKSGDEVLTFNEKTKQNEFKKVIETFKYKNTKRILRVTLKNNKTIICTDDHKFYFKGGWYSLKHILSLK